jgi:sulfate/thiosulfate transport system ATP-binding protein
MLATVKEIYKSATCVPRPGSVEVVVEDVVRTFGETAALHGVSLSIRAGELMALLGPSGSGKTTLLRILAGLDQPGAGRVLFDGTDALGLTVQERHIGFVFQSYALFRHMSVAENVAFGLKVRPRRTRPSGAQIRARVAELLELVQLNGLEKRFPSQLSGGQRQRVALARALAIEPRVLLLDEPFGALDAKVRKDLRRWLRELHRRTGHTTVFVTHDQDEALELAERVAILNKGKIVQIGDPETITEEPASLFVYEFVGEANSLPVEARAGQLWFQDEPLGLPANDMDFGPAILAFRPADVAFVPAGRLGLPGRVVSRARQRADWRLNVDTKGGHLDVVCPTGSQVGEGSQVIVTPTRWKLYPVEK